MGAAVNGLVYHGGFIPFGATFLVFADYMRPPIRLSAIAELRSIWVYTHDSIGVGEDGPTHEPVEQLASLRAIPGMIVLRPCDANETRVRLAGRHREPRRRRRCSCSRASTCRRSIARALAPAEELRRGAYVLNPDERDPELILIGTGSEVALIVGAEPHPAPARPARAPGVDAVVGAVRAAERGVSRERAAARGHGAARRRGRRDRSAGSAGSAATATSSPSIASARRRRAAS